MQDSTPHIYTDVNMVYNIRHAYNKLSSQDAP